jgi:hypothetical protein
MNIVYDFLLPSTPMANATQTARPAVSFFPIPPFPTSVAATINLSWLRYENKIILQGSNVDSLLSGRRYLDSYIELLLSVLPTITILIYSSGTIMKAYPLTISLILEFVSSF